MAAIEEYIVIARNRGDDEEEFEELPRQIRRDIDYEIKRLMATDVAFGVQPNRLRFNQDGDDIIHRANVLRDTLSVRQFILQLVRPRN